MPDAFPVVTITDAQYSKAVFGICRKYGYGFDENGDPDGSPPLVVPDLGQPWTAQPAEAVTFYEANMPQPIKDIFTAERQKQLLQNAGSPDDF
jgi:hypothetical protein